MKLKLLLVVVCVPLLLAGCLPDSNSSQAVVSSQQSIYRKEQPIPFFNFSSQRQELIDIYKAINDSVSTYTYLYSPYLNTLTLICPSISFPIDSATQLDNPSKISWSSTSQSHVLPQAEPDGLYPPNSAEGTYVMCLNNDGTGSPVYSEPNVMTFTEAVVIKNLAVVPVDTTEVPTVKLPITHH